MSLEEFGEYAGGHPEIDKELDDRQVELAKEGSVILEGRVAGWIVMKNEIDAFKIWLSAEPEVRAGRVSSRENKSVEEVTKEISTRESVERTRYLDVYQFDITDLSFYDIVIDTAPLTPEQICDLILAKLQGSDR